MIQLEEKAAEALACVQKAETIMAELGHTKYSLSGMCSAAMRHDLEKEVCELLGELAEAREDAMDHKRMLQSLSKTQALDRAELDRSFQHSMKQRDTLAKTLMRLHDAADAFAADQSEARDERCGLVQPVSVAECEELNQALKAAWELLNQPT